MAYYLQVQSGTPTESGEQTPTTGFSFSHTVENQPNRVLIVSVCGRDGSAAGDTTATVTYGGTPMTAVLDDVIGGGGAAAVRISMFIMTAPPVGTATVAVTMGGSTSAAAIACTFWNVRQSSPQDTTAQSITQSANPAIGLLLGQISITDDRSLIVVSCGVNDTNGFTPNVPSSSNQLVVLEETLGTVLSMDMYKIQNQVAGTVNTQALLDGGNNKSVMVALTLFPDRRRAHAT